MKKILFVLFCSVALVGCGEKVLVDYLATKGETTYYINGTFSGIGFDVYQSGKIKTEVSFKNGKLNGTSRSYYENGNLQSEINYINGKETGTSRLYYENGNLLQEIIYKDGRILSQKNFDENENLEEERDSFKH